METKTCNRCGVARPREEWYASQWVKPGLWCKPCYQQWHRDRYTPKTGADDAPRDCAWCGASYRPKARIPSAYCSRACKDKAKNAADATQREAMKPPRICLQCGGDMPQRLRADAKFCSPECNSRAHALKRKLRTRGGSSTDGYERIAIAERDRWRCGICGGRVAQDKRWPHPMAGSLDHILPVCEGGTSEPANLRLTHLVCNLRRRDRGGGEQLALV